MWSLFIGIIAISGLAYAYIQRKYSYWADRGVSSPSPQFPMGSFQGLGRTRHQAEITKPLYDEWKGKSSFIGMYLFVTPKVLITDPELIKTVLVRDFDNFRNRGFHFDVKKDPLSANLFTMKDNAWKNLRAKITPTFTSGKMKMMFKTILEKGNRMVEHILPIAKRDEIFDIKDIVARFSTDVFGACALGLECNSIKDPDAEFRLKLSTFFNPTRFHQLNLFFGYAFPWLASIVGARVIEKDLSDFFINVVNETIKHRKMNNGERKDFMHLLLEMQEHHNAFSDLEIAAQAFVFFLAGFETSSTMMTFALYELAKQPEIQKRLRQKINDVLLKHNNEITYEAINEMPYLNQVIDETLRKYPIDNLLRQANRDYLVPGTKHVIEKGTQIFIPVFGLHYDPDIYPDPVKFDPDRFTEENKAKRHPFLHIFLLANDHVIVSRFGLE